MQITLILLASFLFYSFTAALNGVNTQNPVPSDRGNKFFISSIIGNDNNEGNSPDSPWKTLGKLTDEIYGGNVIPADSIFLERGSRFEPTNMGHSRGNGQRGLINLPESWHGRPDSWFYIGAYGSGDIPVISDEYIDEYSSAIHSQGSVKYLHLDSLYIEGIMRFDIYKEGLNEGAQYIRLTNLYLDGQNRERSLMMRPSFEHKHPFEYHLLTVVRNIHIENCTFVKQAGEDVLNFSGPAEGLYIGYNKIYGAGEECLDISGGVDHIVEYNLFEGSGDGGQTVKIHSQHRRNERG